MQTMIVKLGNSHGIRIPKTFLQNINISDNDPIDIVLENEKIIIQKVASKKHKTTKERLFAFYGAHFEQNHIAAQEIDWGSPTGDEI